MNSIHLGQLAGHKLGPSHTKSCQDLELNSQMGVTTSIDGNTPLEASAVALPCGLAANSFFNDTFVLKYNQGDGVEIQIKEDGLAWEADRKHR